MAIKLRVLTTITCLELALVVSATAAEPVTTNKPALRLFMLPSASDLKRGHESARSTPRTTDPPVVLSRLTNRVENFSAESAEATGSESALRVELFERMNERPILQSRREEPKRFLDRLPLRGGALLSMNPNARRNPLEVDGW